MSEKTTTTGTLDIGAVLSAARMKRELSIATAAMQSNLSQEIIEKLEQNRFGEIGAPVFTRGYLSLYARFLGLNEAAVGQAFNKIGREPPPELRLSAANVESQSRSYRRSYLGSWLLLIPVVLVGGFLLYQLFDNNSWLMKQINGAFNQPTQQEGEVLTPPGGNNSEDIVLEVGGTPQVPPTTPEGVPVNPEVINGITPPANAATTAGSSETPPATDNSATAPATSEGSRGIQLTFSTESWVQIQDSKRKSVVSRIIKPGEKVELPADGAPYSFNIGRPDGVVMLINGQEQPLDNYRQKNSGRRFNVDIPNG